MSDEEDIGPYFCPDCQIVGDVPHRPYCPELRREEEALYGREDDGEEWDGSYEEDAA